MIMANGFVDKVAIGKTKEGGLEATVKLLIPIKGGMIPDFRVVMSGPVEIAIQPIQLPMWKKPVLGSEPDEHTEGGGTPGSEADAQIEGKEEEIPE